MTKCRKRTYRSRITALLEAQRIGEQGGPSRAYQCPNCHSWHLTSKSARSTR